MSKQCGKNIFSSEQSARSIAKIVVATGRAATQRAYFCYHCKGWHTTSMTKKAFKEAKNGDR